MKYKVRGRHSMEVSIEVDAADYYEAQSKALEIAEKGYCAVPETVEFHIVDVEATFKHSPRGQSCKLCGEVEERCRSLNKERRHD